MLAQLAVWVEWLVLLNGWGWGARVLFGFDTKVVRGESIVPHFWINVLIGMAATGFVGNAVSLLAPVDLVAHYAALGVGVLLTAHNLVWARRHLTFKMPPLLWLACSMVFGLACLMKAAAPSLSYDLGLYYIQTIRWVEGFGSVPGLANVHGRLGFNSTWHLLVALLNNGTQGEAAFDGLNEFLLLGTGLFAFNRASLGGGAGRAALFFLLFTPLLLIEFLGAPAADLPVILIPFNLLLLYLYKEPEKQPTIYETLFLCLFVVSIKLSSLPVLLLPAGLLLASRAPKVLLAGVLGSVVYLAPWLMRFYVLTGYWVYPLAATGFMAPDWQVPPATLAKETTDVKGFARYYLADAEYGKPLTYEALSEMDITQWVPLWASQRRAGEWVLVLVSIIALGVSGQHLIKKVSSFEPSSLFWIMAVLWLVFWFFTAPAIRFGLGPFLLLLALGAYYINMTNTRFQFEALAVLASLLMLFACRDTRALTQFAVLPAAWPAPQTKAVSGLHIVIRPVEGAAKEQCWDAPLPCPNRAGKPVTNRGRNVSEGYRYLQP